MVAMYLSGLARLLDLGRTDFTSPKDCIAHAALSTCSASYAASWERYERIFSLLVAQVYAPPGWSSVTQGFNSGIVVVAHQHGTFARAFFQTAQPYENKIRICLCLVIGR